MPEWETIESTAGGFIGWGTKTGQHVTGKVVDYSIDGGTDFNGNKCPQLAVELTEKAASFNKEGARTDFEPGEIVNVTCGQASLKSTIRRTDPAPGDLLKITLTELAKTANGTAKVFEIKIARGTGAPTSKPAVAAAAQDDDEPPF
jgi:hypothetical protein